MRLDRIGLMRYGHFTDMQLGFPAPADGAPDLHVVYGPNEAGKSTLFSGWLDLLFGIPARTGYNFLHDNRALRLEAAISTPHGALSLSRIKGNTATLRDLRTDAPLPEATLAAALGGLDRDGYTTMFSLDDDTLEAGGKSILDSKGHLGELLFSASAGLADMSTALAALQNDSAAWFAPGKRKHDLAAHKARLVDLATRRKAADLAVSDWRKLVQTVEQTQDAYAQACDRQSETSARLEVLRRDLDALPMLARLRKLEARLAALPPPREVPADWRAALPDWLSEEAELRALVPAAQDRVKELEAALEDMPKDTAAQPHIPQIDTLEGRFGAIMAERADLPRRRAELADLRHRQDAVLARLGRPDLTLDQALLATETRTRLAELIEAHGLLDISAEAARAELAHTKAALRDTPEAQDIDADALARLGPLMAELRRADLLRLHAQAQERLLAARAARDQAFAALVPWHGDGLALAALDLPADDSLRALAQAMADASETARAAAQDHARLDASIARLRAETHSAALVSPEDASASRAARDAAWHDHQTQLCAASARRFEAAMRTDDTVQAARLEQAQRAGKLTLLRQEEASLAQADALVKAANSALARTEGQLARHWTNLGLAPEGRSLPDLRAWLLRRETALTAESAWQEATAQSQALEKRLEAAKVTLAGALDACGRTLDGADFALLMAEGEALLNTAEVLRQQAHLRRNHVARQEAVQVAETARAMWQAEWDDICAGCWIGTSSLDMAPDVAAMRTILAVLSELDPLTPQADTLNRRIARIEEDVVAFQVTLDQLAAALGENPDPDPQTLWPRLRGRLRKAEAQEAARARLVDDLHAAHAKVNALAQRRKRLDDATAPVRAAFSGLSLPETHQQIAAILQAQELTEDCASLRSDLAAHLRLRDQAANLVPDLTTEQTRLDAMDPASAQAQAESLKTILAAQESAVAQAYAALVQAEQARDAAGADGTAARLEAERETLVLQIADEARQFIARQAGILAVEHALRLYRDTHRSEMMARASAAFALLTGGRYTGLSTQPDGRNETLIAQQQGGGSKEVDKLSKGTRFQLYLALRAAGYLELARARPSIPFVADDIMETFDDIRAEAAFRLLAEMAQHGQVIYLTHHAHLCDIARRACRDVHLHNLDAL